MALIRCTKCGNLASSRSAVCPICGERIASEQASPTTVESTPTNELSHADSMSAEHSEPATEGVITEADNPVVAKSPQEEAAPQQPKTLNDILAERQVRVTLNDTHVEPEVSEETSQRTTDGDEVAKETVVAAARSNEAEYDYDDNVLTVEEYEAEIHRRKRVAGGFLIGCIVLLLMLATVGVLYIRQVKDYSQLEDSVKVLLADEDDRHALETDLLRSNAENLVNELSKYKDANDSMAMRYDEAVQMLAELETSNKHTLDQLRRYQREVETLKGIMKQYVRQIDSLNMVNTTLKSENKTMKQQIKSQELRVNQAEELADELNTKVRQGAVIQVSAIKVLALNSNSKEVKRIRLASRLRVDFELTANALAEPGEKSVYVCITNPEGYPLLPKDEFIVFNFEGDDEMASAVRKVDYENNMVPVSIFYDGEAFIKGTYKVDIYIDGRHCGTAEKYFD